MKAIVVKFKEKPCHIMIENRISNFIGELTCKFIGKSSNAAVITDAKVETLYLKTAVGSLKRSGFNVISLSIPRGEAQKNINNLKKIYDFFILAGLDRWSPVFALGGGVIGDLTGFAAATYKRGVPFFQIPTTLLSQVDASIGGKAAVNLPQGKNMVGAFYQPTAIFTDPLFLQSLPDRDIRAGLGEVVKFGMIKDTSLMNFLTSTVSKILSKNKIVLEEIVRRTASIKASIVEKDEKEQGERVILNYGHTIGHAIEAISSYNRFRHGEAVAIGMECELLIALKLRMITNEVFETQHQLLRRCGLPVRVFGIKPSKIIEFLGSDKKAKGGKTRFVLPEKIGKVRFPVIVSKGVLNEAVNYICER